MTFKRWLDIIAIIHKWEFAKGNFFLASVLDPVLCAGNNLGERESVGLPVVLRSVSNGPQRQGACSRTLAPRAGISLC